jgi:hypothetical protein
MIGWVAGTGFSLIVLIVVPVHHVLFCPDLPLTTLEYTAASLAGIWSVGLTFAFGIFRGQ